MIYDWSTERLVAFATFCIATLISDNNTIPIINIEKYEVIENLVRGGINLIFAILLFFITLYLKKWLGKKISKKP